jgi:hypothetical protein
MSLSTGCVGILVEADCETGGVKASGKIKGAARLRVPLAHDRLHMGTSIGRRLDVTAPPYETVSRRTNQLSESHGNFAAPFVSIATEYAAGFRAHRHLSAASDSMREEKITPN